MRYKYNNKKPRLFKVEVLFFLVKEIDKNKKV